MIYFESNASENSILRLKIPCIFRFSSISPKAFIEPVPVFFDIEYHWSYYRLFSRKLQSMNIKIIYTLYYYNILIPILSW